MDKQGTYVDYLRHYKENNTSKIVDKSDENSKKAVLNYRVLEVINNPKNQEQIVSLIDIELLTGRHHQIRVQFAGHATPLYGDERYGGGLSTKSTTMTVDRGRKKKQLWGCTPVSGSVRPPVGISSSVHRKNNGIFHGSVVRSLCLVPGQGPETDFPIGM